MSVTDKQLKQFARLARLDFPDEEIEAFKGEFEEMIAFWDSINSAVEGDAASIREVGARQIPLNGLREDEVASSLPNEKILSNVNGENGYFTVKRVVK
ncbi:MAG: Asp-tRNA(Asn)/Glu-tRNA(Gln) amidotransferase subunit GatC [Clostridia bacterium]|nr:Asp-tRNA(Asn)/Glu-tRNA(Gln) amidotransferase subunit GatC [Clostridia bacterium]